MNSAAIAASAGIPIVYIIGSFWSWSGTALIGGCFPMLAILIFLLLIHWDSPVFLINKNQTYALGALTFFREGSKLDKIVQEFNHIKVCLFSCPFYKSTFWYHESLINNLMYFKIACLFGLPLYSASS